MYTAADFKKAFDDYIQFNKDLMSDIGPMEGLLGVLGFGKKPGHDPGHAEFLREIESAVNQVCQENPDNTAADEIADVIFQAKNTYADEKISPYIFTAVEGMTKNLFPYLSDEKAREIYNDLKNTPMKLRTPIRKQLMAALSSRL